MSHAGATRVIAIAMLAAAILACGACSRLNPDWCAEKAACGPEEYCDPRTNTCRQKEAGPPEAGPDAGADTRPPDTGPDGPPDIGPDGPPDTGPDQAQPDLAGPDLPTQDSGGG